VDPVDASIGKDEKKGDAKDGIGNPIVGDLLVQHRVAPYFGKKPWKCHGIERSKGVK